MKLKIKKKTYDLIATIGLAIFVSNNGLSSYYDEMIAWDKISEYIVYVVIAFALRRYFYGGES